MRNRISWAALSLLAAASLGADGPGLRPRPDASTYPAAARFGEDTVAAAALTPDQVRGGFATDLNKGYLVFEAAFYPGANGNLKISPVDFLLKIDGQSDPIRPAEPAAVARSIQEKNAPQQASGGRTVDVYPVAEVGYESGRYNDDSYKGHQRSGGWYSSVGVGVGVGGAGGVPAPSGASTGRDRSAMEAELFDKSLPEGSISQPTAGYLYFPAPKGKPKGNAQYELQYLGEHGVIKLALSAPRPRH